jgi:hypothetical protein
VRADWAALIAFLLGPGPEVTAHFYFEANSWRLHRLCESNGIGGATLLPEATLLAVVAAMQAGGRPVDEGFRHAAQ